MVRRRQYVT